MSVAKEATARIKINKLLESAGWRFFADGDAPANIRLEPGVTLKSSDLDALGNDFETTSKGFIDFLLLDEKGFSLRDVEIALPGLTTQRAVVAEIEAEQTLVNANRELIRRMETKVKDAIDRVWGKTAENHG